MEFLLQSNKFIDVEALEDDVEVLPSSTDFNECRNQPQRETPITIILDDDLDLPVGPSASSVDHLSTQAAISSCPRLKRPREEAVIDRKHGDELHIHRSKRVHSIEPIFKCTICWGPMAEETSTLCGHIFCSACIETAIRRQKRCPTCRKSLKLKDIHRVYLPFTFSGISA